MNKYQPLKKLELCKRNILNVIFYKEKYIEFGGKVQKGNKMARKLQPFYTTKNLYNKMEYFLDG